MKTILAIPTASGTLGMYDDVKNAPELVLKNVAHDKIEFEGDHKKLLKKIYEFARSKKEIIAVGGDHSISYSLIKAFLEKEKNGFVIVYDAHADMEVVTDIPTHEDWLKFLIEEKLLDPKRLLMIGVRKITVREREFLRKYQIRITRDIKEIPDAPVYASIDVDVLDPKECNDFYYKEKNGLTVEELFNQIKKLKIHSADIVELCPNLGSGKGIKIAKKLVETIAPVV